MHKMFKVSYDPIYHVCKIIGFVRSGFGMEILERIRSENLIFVRTHPIIFRVKMKSDLACYIQKRLIVKHINT
jgi:hypothetical protein